MSEEEMKPITPSEKEGDAPEVGKQKRYPKMTRSKRRDPQDRTSYTSTGRKPRLPSNKVSKPLRFLTTTRVKEVCEEIAKEQGLIVSDLQRLALYRYLEDYYRRKGEPMPEQLVKDTTFDTLRGQGFV